MSSTKYSNCIFIFQPLLYFPGSLNGDRAGGSSAHRGGCSSSCLPVKSSFLSAAGASTPRPSHRALRVGAAAPASKARRVSRVQEVGSRLYSTIRLKQMNDAGFQLFIFRPVLTVDPPYLPGALRPLCVCSTFNILGSALLHLSLN